MITENKENYQVNTAEPIVIEDRELLLNTMINKFPTVLTAELGRTHLVEYDIKLKEKAEINSSKVTYRCGPPKMAILKKEINDLLNKQVIEKTLSPFVSPCFLVKKKPNEGSSEENYRGCILQVHMSIFYLSIVIP
ncbi:hypothetical protein ACUWC3_28190, partial [Klebsiella pneumoniae]|uniref:hypothetical protein n=1 Tax=Klebsiella pneumoniae TaxID=573 RepID=UPI0040554267